MKQIKCSLEISLNEERFSIPGLKWNGSDNKLMVEGSKCSSNEWSDPEDPLKHNKIIKVIRDIIHMF